MPSPIHAARAALVAVFRRVVAIYFREIEIAGEVPSASTGGRLFASNHVNGLVDPVLIITQTPCPISPVAKSTLWKIPGLTWLLSVADAVPIVRRRDDPMKSAGDNDAVFERVAAHLAHGGNILIFPEGTSHNEPHLIALRSGASRMLARACEESADADVTFQAVALEFDARDVFRSRALLLYGPVHHARGVTADAITETMRGDLSELLIEGATWDERVLFVRVAEMFASDAQDRTLAERNRIGRRIEGARKVLAKAAPETVRAVEDRARAYFSALEEIGASDEVVVRYAREGHAPHVELDRVARAAAMIVTLPLALAGMVLYWLPYQLPRLVTERLGGDADTASTYKLGVGLVAFPLWAALLVTLAALKLEGALAWLVGFVALASPFATLPWLDRLDKLGVRLRLLAPSEVRRERVAELAVERAALMQDLGAARTAAGLE